MNKELISMEMMHRLHANIQTRLSVLRLMTEEYKDVPEFCQRFEHDIQLLENLYQ